MSDFRAFCQGKCILDIHTEIPNGVLDLAVAKQELNGSKVAGGFVYNRGFGSPERMRAILLTPQTNSRHPFVDEPGILTCAEVIGMVNPAWEHVVSMGAATTIEPSQQASSRIRKHLELNGATCLLLHYEGACANLSAANQIANF